MVSRWSPDDFFRDNIAGPHGTLPRQNKFCNNYWNKISSNRKLLFCTSTAVSADLNCYNSNCRPPRLTRNKGTTSLIQNKSEQNQALTCTEQVQTCSEKQVVLQTSNLKSERIAESMPDILIKQATISVESNESWDSSQDYSGRTSTAF